MLNLARQPVPEDKLRMFRDKCPFGKPAYPGGIRCDMMRRDSLNLDFGQQVAGLKFSL